MQKQAYSTTCLTQYARMHSWFFDNEDRNRQVESSGAVTKTFNQGLALRITILLESRAMRQSQKNTISGIVRLQICHPEIVDYDAIFNDRK